MNTHRHILLNIFKLSDLFIIALSFFISAAFTYHYSGITFHGFFYQMPTKKAVLLLSLLLPWHLLFSAIGLYQSKRLSVQIQTIAEVIKANTLCTLMLCLVTILFRIEVISSGFIALFWFMSSTLLVTNRILIKYILVRFRLRGRNLRHILFIGTNPRVLQFVGKIREKPELGYQIIGFADDEWSGMEAFRKTGYPLVSDLSGLSSFIRVNVIDEVMIGLPLNSAYQQAARIVQLCENQGIIVRFLPGIFDLRLARSKSEYFEGESVITIFTGAMDGRQMRIKRTLDLLVSTALLILLSPVFLITILLIKSTSPGPIFFVQDRMGLNKRRFRLYKFRTMIPDAEKRQVELEHLNEASGPVFKIRDDPRITPVGKFLRKTSIDELPQLLNVIKGDMSLVGPRPLPIRDFEGFDHDWHRRRFSVRPGITCLWQINGRSSISFEKWMELDIQYIDEWSLWLDLRILTKTVPVVLKGTGAA